MNDHVKAMVDQYFLDRVSCEIISKEETHENFSEASDAPVKENSLKGNDTSDYGLKKAKRRLE